MTIFVAEVSSNHNQDLDRCLAFVDEARRIGCDAVKFQLFTVDQLFSPDTLERNPNLKGRKKFELPPDFLPAITRRCQERGIQFACTPFHLEAVKQLEPYVAFYKIASYELLWDDLLVACARAGKPVVLSTGMATLEEVRRAVNILQSAGTDTTVLHCVSSYPTPIQDCNLAAIETLRRLTPKVGWSDHSVSPAVIYRAVHRFGAEMVEFHLDLADAQGEESRLGLGHCWLPDQIGPVIQATRDGFLADGDGVKMPVASETPDVKWRADPEDGLRPLQSTRIEAAKPIHSR